MRRVGSVGLGLVALAALLSVADARDGCGSGYYFNGHRCRPMQRPYDGRERRHHRHSGIQRAKRPETRTATALAAVKQELRVDDAVFDALRFEGGAICGLVEAKNGPGENTGRMLFVYVSSEGKGTCSIPGPTPPRAGECVHHRLSETLPALTLPSDSLGCEMGGRFGGL